MGAVADYLRGRGIDPAAVARNDLARVLPTTGAMLPMWARCLYPLRPVLLVRLFDARGQLRSFQGRRANQGEGSKSLTAKAGSVGLVMACPTAWHVLNGSYRPTGQPLHVICAEGEIDLFTWRAWCDEHAGQPVAVFGVSSGAWTAEHTSRLPPRSVVAIRTHDDDGGRLYADSMKPGLLAAGHTVIDRLRTGSQPDDNDLIRAAGQLPDPWRST